MHDIDQVQLEDSGPPGRPYTHEYETEYETEYDGEDYLELEDEYEDEADESELDEHTELELTSQFLEVSNEQELEHVLGDLLSAVTGAASDFARSREGRQLGGILKQAAHRVLPAIGATARHAATNGGSRQRDASGRYRKSPHRESVTSVAKRCFGLELEGVSLEDQEFEVSRQFIRFAVKAIEEALAKQGTGPAPQIAKQAVVAAARAQAPGLVTERVLDSARVSRTSPAARRPGTVVPAPHANHQPAVHPQANHQPAAQPGATGRTPCPRCGLTGGARGGRWEIRGNAIVLLPH